MTYGSALIGTAESEGFLSCRSLALVLWWSSIAMLEPQTSELPHETEYFLDSAVECLDLDHGARMTLITFGDRARIAEILEGRALRGRAAPLDMAGTAEAKARYARFKALRLGRCVELTAYADEILTQLGPKYRIGAHITAVRGLLTEVARHAEIYADWAVSDSYEGGYLERFNRRVYTRWRQEARDRDGTKRTGRKLRSPAFIKRYIVAREESLRLRACWHAIARRGVPKFTDADLAEGITVFDAAFEEHRARLREAERRAEAAFWVDFNRDAEARTNPEPKVVIKVKKSFLRERAQRRKTIKRAAMLAAGFLGASAVSAFANGKPVLIEGREMAFEVSKASHLARIGHGAVRLAVLDTARARLAELCFYIEDTPALDQLVAIDLAVRAGEEREILSTANVTKIEAAGVGHALLGARGVPEPELQPVRRAAWRNGVIVPAGPTRQELQHARNTAYFAETKDLWIDTLGVYTFNRDWKSVKGMMPT